MDALNKECVEKTEAGIESIDVVVRPGKKTGRGLKVVTHREYTSVVYY